MANPIDETRDPDIDALLAKDGHWPVDYRFLFNSVIPMLKEMRKGHDDRAQQLEARIAALEARPELKWAGIYTDGQLYPEAALVTRSGSLWLSTAATMTTPGTPNADWKLIVKKGHV